METLRLPTKTANELQLMTIPQLKDELTQAGVSTRGLRLKADYIQRHLENQGQIQHAATPAAIPKVALTPKIAVPKAVATPKIAVPKAVATPKIAVPKAVATPKMAIPKVTGQVTPITVPLKITLTPKALPKVAGPVRTASPPVLGLPPRSRDELMKMTISQIKAELVQNGIGIQGLKLKADYIQKYLDSQGQAEPVQKVPSPVQKVPSPVQKVPSPVQKVPSPVQKVPSPALTTIAPLVTIVPKAASPLPKAASPLPKAASPVPKAASPAPLLPAPKPILVPQAQKRPSPGRIRFEDEPQPQLEVVAEPTKEIKIETLPRPLNGCVATDIGRRPYQEDRSVIAKAKIGEHEIKIFAVYDGHGGYEVSQYLVDALPKALIEELQKVPNLTIQPRQPKHLFNAAIESAIKDAYLKVDKDIFNRNMQAGSTAILFLQIGDIGFLVNTGDSRGAIYIGEEGNTPVLQVVSDDHKPNDVEERRRIQNAGGFVANQRVDGILAVARAFGDNMLKYNKNLRPLDYPGFEAVVSVKPDIYPVKKEPNQKFIGVLASDGIWDVIIEKEITMAITRPNLNLSTFCSNMVRLALNRRSGDNMTAMAFES